MSVYNYPNLFMPNQVMKFTPLPRPIFTEQTLVGVPINLMAGMIHIGNMTNTTTRTDENTTYLYSSWEVLATGAMCRCRVGDRVILVGPNTYGVYPSGDAKDFICRESDIGAILDRDEDKAETEKKMGKQKKDAEDALFGR